MTADLAAFLGVSLLVIVAPGPDTVLTIRNAFRGGRTDGAFTALGVASGQACWTLAASAGLVALLAASEPAFLALRVVGAAYLVYLGAQSLWRAVRTGRLTAAEPQGARPADPTAAFRQGVLSNLGNPKMAVFFTSLLPQFAPGGADAFGWLLILGLVFCLLTLGWLTCYAVAVAKAGDVLRGPRIRRVLDAAAGTVLVALGLRVAAERA